MKRKSTLLSALFIACIFATIVIGSTYAYFIDDVQSTGNVIKAGNLNMKVEWATTPDATAWNNLADEGAVVFNNSRWEPNHTQVRYIRISNTGKLAFQYRLDIVPMLTTENPGYQLGNVIEAYVEEVGTGYIAPTGYQDLVNKTPSGTVASLITSDTGAYYGQLLQPDHSITLAVVLHMDHEAGNEYQGLSVGEGFQLKVYATQTPFERDAFGTNYDQGAELPKNLFRGGVASMPVNVVNGVTTDDVTLDGGEVHAFVPAGTRVNPGTTVLTLRVTTLDKTASGVTAGEGETLLPVDVHIEGVAEDNESVIIVTLDEVLITGLNIGNTALYHVEDGQTVKMAQELTAADLTAHNEYYYNPANGTLMLAMDSFSEVAMVSAKVAVWEGNYDYSWYTNAVMPLDGEGTANYVIANADQLAAFGAIVGGMNGQTQDSFAGKTVELIADVDLGYGVEGHTYTMFYPIGYYNSTGNYEKVSGDSVTSSVSSFEGTFDGKGHTISNIYQNTWEMFGDYNDGYTGTPNHYKDAMGLFGYVHNGTVKNLTVDNFSSDGEFTPTGVIAAYAVNSTFENIAITNCNPRVYNTGNGGIVGIGGNNDDPDTYKLTFNNITIDNTNKITALWGSWDVACGGLVGMFRGAGHVNMTNCHVAAQIDVYNDVCGNYQYYWYRYSGMMVGTNKNMTTDEDGYTVPETSKFHAEGCTVHFGEWNDYYYCELVANSLASYTHDHQFSRLTQVDSVDVTKKTVTVDGKTTDIPTSGRYNYVVVNGEPATENATCYHFVDGEVWNHEDAGEETVNGETVLKEDKRHVYLPFNQLFTGYGWGVKHIPVYNGENYAFEGIEILDREVANSQVKFEEADTAKDSYMTTTTVNIGDLFKAAEIEDKKLTIKSDKVQVFVSPVAGTGSTAGAVYTANTTDWTQGTLTFSGTGAATITITDYYYCTPTTIEVTITERVAEEKFDIKLNNGDFLHRVGNQNAVSLDSLFEAKKGATIGNVSVTVEAVNGTGASGTYTPNATWTNGTIQFSGTGVVKVTIQDDDKYCTPTVLYLEVVDAKNITNAESATANDVVLLNDTSASSLKIANGYAFYGNGFEVKFGGDGSYRSAAVSYGFVTVENGGILDNVQVKCNIFPESYMFASEMKAGSDGRYPYGYSAVVVSGNSTISNCYIYGARNNIQVGVGNVTIKNTVTECGSLSNIHINSNAGYTVTLDNVTTIQYQTTSDYDPSKTVLGFGILVGTNESESNPTIKLTGELLQYNWVTDADTNVSNSYAKQAISEALKVEAYHHTINGKTAVNTGIVWLNALDAPVVDERTNKERMYEQKTISMLSYTGRVYSIIDAQNIESDAEYDSYTPSGYDPIYPTGAFVDTNSAITVDKGRVPFEIKVSFDLDNIDGGSYAFKFNDLNVQKYGIDLQYTVKDSEGNTVDKATEITLNQLMTSNYTLVVIDNQIYDEKGEKTGSSITREIPFILSATKTSIDPPEFTNAGTATAIRLVSSKGGDWRPAYTALTGVSVTYWSASEGKVKTVDLSTLYSSGTISSNVWTYTCDDYTLTITGGAVHSDGTTITPVVANNTLYFASTNKAFTTGTTSRSIILTYVFTDKNASTTWNRTETVAYSNLSEYDYNSFKNNGTLTEPSSGNDGCVTPDTLITLADGTQKQIQHVTYDDQLLVWNFYTGEYTTAPAALIVNHGMDQYTVIELVFEDGTMVKAVNAHAFFDADENKFVLINADNAASFVGHRFVKQDGSATKPVQLMESNVYTAETESYTLVSAEHYNFITEGMFSLTNAFYPMQEGLVVGENLKYDEEILKADIAEYGLYTYGAYSEYITETQFIAFGGPHLRISVEKGYTTYEYTISLIEEYLK